MTVDPAAVDGRRQVRERNRQRLLRAASELFAQRGYRGTTTREIATAAGITERTLFRHVSSKAELFREAVVLPVEDFIERFRTGWNERPPGARETEVEAREFLLNLVDVVDRERNLLLALIAALAYEGNDEELPGLHSILSPLLAVVDEVFAIEGQARGWDIDPTIGVRTIVGAVLALRIHADWLFDGKRQPSREHVADELTKLVTWGLTGRPA